GDATALADELHALAGEAKMLDLRRVAEDAIQGEAAARAWSNGADGSRAASASRLEALSAAVASLASAPRRRPSGRHVAGTSKGKSRPKILVVDDSEIV